MYLDIGRNNDDDYDEEFRNKGYHEQHGDEKNALIR